MRKWVHSARSVVATSVAAFAFGAGCGGGTPPPETGGRSQPAAEPERSPDVAPASSARVQEGIDAIEAEDFARAKDVLTKAYEASPTDPQAAFYLGVALQGLEDFDGAKEMFEKALALDVKLVDAYVNLSSVLLDAKKDARGALEVVRKGLAIDPRRSELLVNRALALEVTGGEGVVEAYRAAVEAVPGDAQLRYAYAENLARAGRKADATEQLGRVAKSDDPVVRAAVSRLYYKLKEFSGCIAVLDDAIASGATADLHVRRGACKHGAKDDAGAEADYRKALELDGSFAPAHYYLGAHLCANGKKKQGRLSLEKALKLAGDQGVGPAAKKQIGRCK